MFGSLGLILRNENDKLFRCFSGRAPEHEDVLLRRGEQAGDAEMDERHELSHHTTEGPQVSTLQGGLVSSTLNPGPHGVHLWSYSYYHVI